MVSYQIQGGQSSIPTKSFTNAERSRASAPAEPCADSGKSDRCGLDHHGIRPIQTVRVLQDSRHPRHSLVFL